MTLPSTDRLRDLVGRERSLREVAQTLHFFATNLSAAAVGALQVTCADETEHECVEAFQKGFVHYLLPQLKFARQSAFRVANLGGRYEWGAVRIAEQHYGIPRGRSGFKLLLIKINSHVAFEPESTVVGESFRFGRFKRYDRDSDCCGALAALLDHAPQPFSDDLREIMNSEGKDRLATLLDESRVPAVYRPLYAALLSARLQARKVVLDIQDYPTETPTFFLVLAAATVNRHERDTEIVSGLYTIDGREGGREATYYGLGDDPAEFETRIQNRLFVVSDEQLGTARTGRDHRALPLEEWRRRTEGRPVEVADERLDRIREDVSRNKHRNHHHARALLRAALPILAEVAPIPTAILLFADGAVGIHHTFRVHKIAREMAGSEEAREILNEIHDRVDRLTPDRAEALIELLMRDYRP